MRMLHRFRGDWHPWQTGLTLASSSAVSAFYTTAAATGISALESYILKNELMKEVPSTTNNGTLYSSTFICSILTARALQMFHWILG